MSSSYCCPSLRGLFPYTLTMEFHIQKSHNLAISSEKYMDVFVLIDKGISYACLFLCNKLT